ncbi:MAG TPA: HAD family hydrolase [Candidatus Thermoplasmatota archaeon]|nr:HAD family hydrolase [Candidatus Thermoplasmatota archaeon]
MVGASSDPRSTLRAVFIDVDDTLYDFAASVTASMAHVRERYRDSLGHVSVADLETLYNETSNSATKEEKLALLAQSPWKYRRFLWEGVLERLEARGTPPKNPPRDLAGGIAEAFATFRFSTLREYAYPGALEALTAASLRYRVGIITNGPPQLQRAKIHALGIHTLVEPHLVFVSGEFGEDKPSPNLFHAAAKAADVEPHHCAMVGDNLECDIGSRAVGMYTILFHTKPHEPAILDCKHPPHHVARSWREVREHLDF